MYYVGSSHINRVLGLILKVPCCWPKPCYTKCKLWAHWNLKVHYSL